ncbi:hypothetical protein KVT40_002432 [Elsinoe batatas]|uniref:Uncharacterized protein n=1 Tax=Elsinoe batatas TaxID=2601811 RepID=A0A8K0L9Y8_9PEZI|nr:hypothetical protein KVT40_002432 [Elsinoe batatas]
MDSKASHNPFEALGEDVEEESITSRSPVKTPVTQTLELDKQVQSPLTLADTQTDAQKHAAEKLRRQTERIAQSELAIEDMMKSKSSGRTARSKKWTPFDFREAHEESPIRDDSSVRSATTTTPFDPTAQVFQPIPINLPAKEVSIAHLQGPLALSRATNESHWVTASRSKSSILGRDENHNPAMSTTYNKREISEVFGNALPSPTYCASHPGTKNGQIVFCIHPNGDVSAQQWSNDHYQWVNIGQYSNSRKKTEGQLASSRIRGESEALSLQQSSLAYFHAIAKQREAEVMGIPFGPKEVQACMPNLNLRRVEPEEPSQLPSHAPVAPAAHYKGLPKPVVALPKQANQRSTPLSGITASTLTKPSPLEELQRRGEYLKQLADAQSRMNNVTFGTMAFPGAVDHPGGISTQRTGQGGYPSVILPQHGGPVASGYNYSFGGYANDHTAGNTTNAFTSGSSSRRSTYSSHAMSSLFGGGDGVTPGRPTSAKPYIPESLQRLAQTNSTRASHQAAMQHIPEEASYASHSAYEHYYEQDYTQGIEQYAYPESLIYGKTPCKPPLTRGLTREVSHSSIHELGETEAEELPQPGYHSYQLHPSEVARLQDPPTPQRLDGHSLTGTPTHTSSSQDLSDYDRDLKSWFQNKIVLDRHASFYNAIMSHTIDETPTRPSKAKDPGVIGPPSSSLKPHAKDDHKMIRHDSTIGSAPTPPASVGMDKESTTLLLIPLLENLKGYTQGPVAKRRGYWAPFVEPPEWAVDKSLGGNLSFYEEDWGRVPERIGRDWRYRGAGGVGGRRY